MLRKRQLGERPAGAPWKNLTSITNSQEETIPINEYFAARPEMMLGEMLLTGRMYARSEPTLASNGRDLAGQLAEAVVRLPGNVLQP